MNPIEILNAFKEEERVEGFYESLTEEEKIARNIEYTQLKINVDIHNKKVAEFQSAKDQAFEELRLAQDAEKIALGQLWQEAEDNDYTAI